MNEPLVKSSADLVEPLVAEVARLGGLAEAQIADGVDAVTRRDVPLAQAVIARDVKLDALQADIERRAIDLIATRQPTGRSLRRAVAALKIAMNLERCGDLARNIAKRAVVVSESEPFTPVTRSITVSDRLSTEAPSVPHIRMFVPVPRLVFAPASRVLALLTVMTPL